MTPFLLFQYFVAVAAGIGCILFVIFCYVCVWSYLVGSKGREQ